MNTAVAVASLASAKAVASPTLQDPDPIFAAIEKHLATFMCRMAKGNISIRLDDHTPEHDAASAEEDVALAADDDAERELVETVPTTMAGALALLKYVDDLYAQKIRLPEAPKGWFSQEIMFQEYSDDEIVSPFDGEPVELPLIFWALHNALATLSGLRIADIKRAA